MELTSMQFKDFVWPHNPRRFEMSYKNRVTEFGYPQGGYALEHMGYGCRVFRGQGEFVGEHAYEQFTQLAATFYDRTPGLFVHPLWKPTKAYMVSLTCSETPRADYVSYAFELWECPHSEQTENASALLHTVSAGETLASIAAMYGVDMYRLMADNPEVRNPSQLAAGTLITVKGGKTS